MSAISIILVIIGAFLAGMEGILDQFEFHQPLVACTLIGLVTGHLKEGVMLGGSLQLMALGWANIGAAVAPDAALASVASAIIMVLGLNGGTTDTTTAIRMFLTQAVANNGFPFEIKKVAANPYIAISEKEVLDRLAKSRDQSKNGEYSEAGDFVADMRTKYGI